MKSNDRMGRQVNFYLHTKDLERFYDILKERDIVFLPTQYDEMKLTRIESPSVAEVEDLYLVREEDLGKLSFRELGGVNKAWGIDTSKDAPVVHLDRSGYLPEHGIIRRGRLYFQPDYYEGSRLIKKDETFIKLADSLISSVRRKLAKRTEIRGFKGSFYLGEYANKWVEQNPVEVRSGGFVLEIVKQIRQQTANDETGEKDKKTINMDNQFLIDQDSNFQVLNEGLTKERIDTIIPCDFKGKDDLIRFYLAYDGVFFNEGAVVSTELFLKDDEDEYYELEIESIYRIDQIQSIWEAIKEQSAEAKKFMETHIPFAGDAAGNHFFIEIFTGEIKYVSWEYGLEEGLIWVAPSFKDFCSAIKPMD